MSEIASKVQKIIVDKLIQTVGDAISYIEANAK